MFSNKNEPVTAVYTDTVMEIPKQNVYLPTVSQWMSLMAGALIFVPGGMSLAYGLGWNMHTHVHKTTHLRFSWFLAYILGVAVSTPFIKYLEKRKFMYISAPLVIVGGIIFTSAPYSYAAILVARYLNGFAIGFITVAFLVHASEIAANSNRGFCLWLEQNSMTVGIVIQVVYSSQWSSTLNFAADRLHGIFAIIFGVLAYICTYFIIESPIFYIRHCNDAQALNCLQQLQRPQTMPNELLQQLLNEQKSYVTATTTFGWRANLLSSPLLRLTLYRSVVAFGFSLPLSEAMKVASVLVMGEYSWPPIIFAILRVGGTFSALYMFDVTGRKVVALVALLMSAVLYIAIAGEYADEQSIYNEYNMSVICVLQEILQYFAGLYAPSSSIYLSEGFPLQLKPYFIAYALIVQQAIHVIVICSFRFNTYSMYAYSISVGVLMFIFCLMFGITMPETRKLTLEEARERFKRRCHLCYGN